MDLLRQIFTFIWALIITFIPQKSYKEGLVGQPQSFLPNQASTENDIIVSKLLFRGLFKYDKDGKIVEDLADSYSISDDGLSYTIYLKRGQRWTNGSEITADDLLFSAFSTPELSEIATDRIDKHTIRYTLPNKYSPFLSVLTVGVFPAISDNNPVMPVSSGPYKVVRVKRDGPVTREVILQRVDEAFRIEKVSFRYYQDDKELFTAEKLGEIDGFVSTDSLTWPNLIKYEYPQYGVYYSLIFNTRSTKLNKPEVRKKLAALTPIAIIAKSLGSIAAGPISGSEFSRKDLNFNLFDPGFSESLNLDLTLTIPDTEEHRNTAAKVLDAWRKANVNVSVKAAPSDEIESKIIPSRDFEVLLFGQQVSRDPDRYPLWHSTRATSPGLNISGFENMRSDRALEEGRSQLAYGERFKHYGIFQEVIHENVPAIFLYHPILKFYASKKIRVSREIDLYYSRDRYLDFQNWDVL